MTMNGYVRNMSPVWAHVLKREVGPGKEIPLAELYDDYGKKHSLPEGDDFVAWLRSVKLKDRERWKIVFVPNEEKTIKEDDISPDISLEVKEKAEVNDVQKAPLTEKNMEVSDIVELSVRKAREVIPKVRDLTMLRYALAEANQRANKDSLCKILRKRIQEIQISR